MAISYDGLYTLRCTPSSSLSEAETTTELFESDPVGNALTRPEIDEPDALPAYFVKLDLDSQAMHLVDPLSGSTLSTTTTLAANKLRLVTLHNPTLRIEMKNKSLISYEWAWKWGEDWRLVWNRNRDSLSTRDSGFTLSMSRKPDPNIDLCCYRPNKKGNLVQILDYNLNRLEIEDRKGLEVAILSTLFSILNGDKLDAYTKAESSEAGGLSVAGPGQSSNSPSPRPGNRRQNSDEVESISPNEILISTHLSEEAYIGHCLNLMSDPNLIYLTLVANSAETVPRAISIASEIKRRVIKSSPREDENLMQYIDYPGRTRRESNKDKTPPGKIKIYLSRIQLEEFTPRPSSADHAGGSASEKERVAAALNHCAGQAGGGGATQSTGKPGPPKASMPQPARLQRPNGAPPLPPKNQSTANTGSGAEHGRFRALLGRIKSDP